MIKTKGLCDSVVVMVKGSIDVKLPPNLVLKDASVIANAQIPDSGVILGAIELSPNADDAAKSTPGSRGDAK
jgi:hypothetical protein